MPYNYKREVYVQFTFNIGVIYDPASSTLRRTRYPLHRKLGGLSAGLDGCKNLVPFGVRTPNPTVRSAYALPSHKEDFKGKTKQEGLWGNGGVVDN